MEKKKRSISLPEMAMEFEKLAKKLEDSLEYGHSGIASSLRKTAEQLRIGKCSLCMEGINNA